MRRADAMMAHPLTGHIYLRHEHFASAVQIQCEVVQRKRLSQKAKKDALALKRSKTLRSGQSQEIILTQDYLDLEAQLEAHLATEDALFARDVARGEEVAEELALEKQGIESEPVEYTLADFFERCACEGTYGLNDDGEVAYHACHRR